MQNHGLNGNALCSPLIPNFSTSPFPGVDLTLFFRFDHPFGIVVDFLFSHQYHALVIAYENSRNPQILQQNWISKTTKLAYHVQPVDPTIRERALNLESSGVKALDALHIACAEEANADYFITCDDRLIRRYLSLDQQKILGLTPTEFVRLYIGDEE